MAKYNYTDHHYDWMWECHEKGMTYGEVLKNWPFEDMIPSRDSIRRRYPNMQHFGLEAAKNNLRKLSNKRWTEEERKELALAYHLCEGSMEEIVKLCKEIEVERSPNAIIDEIQLMQAEDKLPRFESNNSAQSRNKDWTEDFLKCGLKIIGNSFGGAYKTYEVECLAFGHKSKKKAKETYRDEGCGFCSAAGKVSLETLRNTPEGKSPCVVYFVEFEDGVVKVGHSVYGAVTRGKGWPPFKILKEIHTTTFHARRIETTAHHDFERIELYKPTAGNGGKECFQPIYKQSILKYLEEEERNLPEDAKNIT